jgi:hypothetical protein
MTPENIAIIDVYTMGLQVDSLRSNLLHLVYTGEASAEEANHAMYSTIQQWRGLQQTEQGDTFPAHVVPQPDPI